ncbi:MAG: response regulator [Burkholderiales bacterium]
MEAKQHILIVDDDTEMCRMLCEYFSGHGYEATAVGDGSAMDDWLVAHEPDLILLDIMLPGSDGLVLAQKIRERGDCPIIMVSARGADIDRIIGLELGADDYLAKPFNPRELLARVKALLRRRSAAESPARQIRFGRFCLNLEAHSLSCDGVPVDITTAEFTLLRILAQNPGRVLSREALVSLAQGEERMPFDRSVDVRIARLRRKMESDPDAPRHIRTVWGAGYLFVLDGEA